jgi:hypothetical protein
MYDIVYKNHHIRMILHSTDNNIERNIRMWFILKNYNLVTEGETSIEELDNLASVYIKQNRYKCKYHPEIEEVVQSRTSALYVDE